MLKLAIFTLIFFSMIITPAFGQTTLTTYRDDGNMTIFDGKWTFTDEWKRTAIEKITYENGFVQIVRIGHDFEYLYVLIDFVSDTSIDRLADKGIVCIDGFSDGGKIPKSDDYCFLVAMGSENVFTLQGGHILGQKGSYKKIENHSDLIGIGGIFAVLTYSDGTEITSEPEIDTEAEEPGEVLKLRLGEAVSMGESP